MVAAFNWYLCHFKNALLIVRIVEAVDVLILARRTSHLFSDCAMYYHHSANVYLSWFSKGIKLLLKINLLVK